ncbi:hypothetical protein I5328_01155 [Enterococcus faecium]|nr:hypothetical protein [Enterococcus faecium]
MADGKSIKRNGGFIYEKVSQMWNGNERKLRYQGGRRRIRDYNVIGRKQAVRRQNGETEGSNLSEVRRSLHLCGRCREAVTVNGGCMK